VKKLFINLFISLTIGAVFVWLAVRGVNWPEVSQVLARVDWRIIALYFLVWALIHLVRTIRWGVLLRPLGTIRFQKLLSASSVGFMALVLLPLRLGEFARPLLVSQKGKIRVSAALATIVVERVADSLAMAVLLVVLVFFLQGRVKVPEEIVWWGIVVLAVFVLLSLFLVLAYRHQESAVRWFQKIFGFLPVRILDRLVSILRSFIGGLRALPDRRLVVGFLLLTVLYWVMNAGGMVMLFWAFEGLSSLGWLESFTVLALLCVGLMIPAGPGMIGNFHYFVKLGISLFVGNEVLESAGVAYAILLHALQLFQQVLWGVPFLFLGHIKLSQLLLGPRGVEADLEPSKDPSES
jgi:glycosyltransferase 2 family protein